MPCLTATWQCYIFGSNIDKMASENIVQKKETKSEKETTFNYYNNYLSITSFNYYIYLIMSYKNTIKRRFWRDSWIWKWIYWRRCNCSLYRIIFKEKASCSNNWWYSWLLKSRKISYKVQSQKRTFLKRKNTHRISCWHRMSCNWT